MKLEWTRLFGGYRAKGVEARIEVKRQTKMVRKLLRYDPMRSGPEYQYADVKVGAGGWYWSIGFDWREARVTVRQDGYRTAAAAKAACLVAVDDLPDEFQDAIIGV